jgi:glucose/mannose-6-phosphate isomerase
VTSQAGSNPAGAPEEESFLPHDSEGMLAATAAMGDHLAAALDQRGLPRPAGAPSVVVVLGMGGSAVAGSILAAFAAPRSHLPVVVSSGYRCPVAAGSSALVFAVSFSGETEETLAAAEQAVRQGARLIALTGGGPLAELAAAHGGDVMTIPPGIPQPRAGVAAMAAPLLLAAEQLGVVEGVRRELELAHEQLARRLPGIVAGGGLAAEVARRIGRTIPLVHGESGLGAVAARRWKTQVNENAKAPAFTAEQPEVCHNEVCGFGQHGDVPRQLLTVVELRLPGEHPGVARRFELVAEAVGEAVADVVRVRGEGDGELAAFFDLVALGDVVSLHLAAHEGIDPGPVPVLAELKAKMRAGASA